MKIIEVKFVTDKKEEAVKIAEYLLDKKLIACAQVFPIESRYVWKSEKCKTDEIMVILKTKKNLYKLVELEIKKYHSYEVAEIISNPIMNYSKEFFNWIKENTI